MPDRGKELILADDPVVIGEQKLQNIEYLRLQLDNALARAQFALVEVKSEVVEYVDHSSHRSGAAPPSEAGFLRRP